MSAMDTYSPPITRLKARTNPKLRARLQSTLSLSSKDESSSAEVMYFKNNDTTPVCLDIDEDKGKSAKGGDGVEPEKAAFKRVPSVQTMLNPVITTSPITMISPHLPLSSSSSSSCSETSVEAVALPNTPRPSCKRNRKSVVMAVELKLSQEEVQMKGVLEGAVYHVDVLDTPEFQPSSCPEKDVQVVKAACNSTLWADQYSAINSLRRLSIYHHDQLTQNEGRFLSEALSFLCTCIGSLRSSMIRNTLLALKDIFTFVPWKALQAQVCALTPLISVSLQRCTSDKKFICASVKEALLSGARSGICLDVLHMVLPMVHDKRLEVSAHATQIAEVALASSLGVGSKAVQGLPCGLQKADLFSAMSCAAQGKSSEGRSAALQALCCLKRVVGPQTFEKELREHVADADAITVLAMRIGVKGMAVRRNLKSSIREKILAAKLLSMSMGSGTEAATADAFQNKVQVSQKNQS